MPNLELTFGGGLDRETGIMAVRPTSFEDLRNVILQDGKAVVRRGFSLRLTLAGTITHILAIQELRSDRTAIVITYDSATGLVNVHGIDAAGTTSTLIGAWFTKAFDIATPPIISTTEVFGRVFMANAEASVTARASTYVYDQRQSPALFELTADLDNDGTAEPVKFRGVQRHLAYLTGWGYGNEIDQERPEMLRISKPGEPEVFDPEHYALIGDRRAPIVTAKPAGKVLAILKEDESHQLVGTDRATFGVFPIDQKFGILGDRLALDVNGLIYFWSSTGPRISDGRGPSGDLAVPLDYYGFDPATLVAEGSAATAFAVYEPIRQLVCFFFGKRVYVLTLKSGISRARWMYWEIANFTPHSGAPLFQGDSGVFPAPTGNPTCGSLVSAGDGGSLTYTWNNNSPDGDEFLEVWLQQIANLAKSWKMDTDGGGGVASDFAPITDAAHTAAYTIDTAAQKIAVTAATAAGLSGVNQGQPAAPPGQTIAVVAGKTYMLEVEAKAANLVGGARGTLTIKWYDATPAVISTETRVTFTATTFALYKLEATAPVGAVAAEIYFEFESLASGDTGEVWFKRARFFDSSAAWTLYNSENVSTAASQVTVIGGTNPGSGYRVRSRYGRGFAYTAGYTSGDPDAWPNTSECYELATSAGVRALFVAWWMSNSGGLNSRLLWAIDSGTWSAMQAAGATAGFRIDRDIGAGLTEIHDLFADLSNPPIASTLYFTDWKDVLHFGYDHDYAGETYKATLPNPHVFGLIDTVNALVWFELDDLGHAQSEIDVDYRVTPYIGGEDLTSSLRQRYMGPEHEVERAALGDGPVTGGHAAGSLPTGGGPLNFSTSAGGAGDLSVSVTHSSWFWEWVQNCYCDLNGFCEIDIVDHYRKQSRSVLAQWQFEYEDQAAPGTWFKGGWNDCNGGGPGPNKFVETTDSVTIAAATYNIRIRYKVVFAGVTAHSPYSASKSQVVT